MPELPEVETVVRGLRAVLPGRGIVAIRFGKTDFIDDPAVLEEFLPGSRITAVERFGKFIRLDLKPAARHLLTADESATGEQIANASVGDAKSWRHLVIHLGMTGRLAVRPAQEPCLRHTHVFFELDDGRELRYTDPRRFGRMLLVPDSGMAEFGGQLGEDPLEISAQAFQLVFGGRRARVKALLLDQRVLRGVGNIYADESLWRARIHPARLASGLSAAELSRLRAAILHVLRHAIRLGGSSISDFVDAEGNPGEFQLRHRIYQRHGKPCFHCGATIRRAIIAGRSSHYCPRCQPPSRRSGKRRGRQSKTGAKARPQARPKIRGKERRA
jgi:formamidopyrimidine-DNA glycosylase